MKFFILEGIIKHYYICASLHQFCTPFYPVLVHSHSHIGEFPFDLHGFVPSKCSAAVSSQHLEPLALALVAT